MEAREVMGLSYNVRILLNSKNKWNSQKAVKKLKSV